MENNEKWAKLYFYFSVLVSLVVILVSSLLIYSSLTDGDIKRNLDDKNWFITLGVIFTNVVNIYVGVKEKGKDKNRDIIFNKYILKGSMLIITSVVIFDLIPILYITLI